MCRILKDKARTLEKIEIPICRHLNLFPIDEKCIIDDMIPCCVHGTQKMNLAFNINMLGICSCFVIWRLTHPAVHLTFL